MHGICVLIKNSHPKEDFVTKLFWKQECIPVGCAPPTAVTVGGGSPPGTPPRDQVPPPDQAPPWDQAPPDQTPTQSRHPPGAGTPCGQTHTCKHITLPQTSFAGGKNE